MEAVVVDTNVAIVANRNADTHADEVCQLACVERLETLTKEGIVAIDDEYLILKEYLGYLTKSSRAKSTGDIFFIHVLRHLYNTDLIRKVSVTPVQDEKTGFEELPRNTFDRSDRKFLAVAVVAKAKVLNATDSDWAQHSKLMTKLGINVEELCPQHIKKESSKGKR